MGSLLATAPESSYALLWTLRDKRSYWEPIAAGASTLAAKAVDLARRSDVYIGVSVVDVPGPPDRRTSNENSAGLYGLWADIDIANPDIHKKWNLPPDENAASTILSSSRLEPTLVVHSGHGLQAWWLFKEFWSFDTENDRRVAYDLAQKWNTTLRVRAAEHHWVLDSTFDLGRVMRVPGTVNLKGEPQPVRLLTYTERRYNRDDVEDCLVDDSLLREHGIVPIEDYQVGALALGVDRWPEPPGMLDALLDNNEKARAVWEGKVAHLHDQSGSSIDLSLASLAVASGWNDQQVADLIMARRRKHVDNPEKALRLDYIRSTLRRAHNQSALTVAPERADEAIQEVLDARVEQDQERERDARSRAFDEIGAMLGGIKIVGFQRFMSEDRQYALLLGTTDRINFKTFDDLATPRKAYSIIKDHVGPLDLPRYTQPGWDPIVNRLLALAQDIDVGAESTETGQVAVWMEGYFAERSIADSRAEALETGWPWRDDDGVHIWSGNFKAYLHLHHQIKLSPADLGRLLKQYGCEKETPNVIDPTSGKRTQRTAWLLPGGGR